MEFTDQQRDVVETTLKRHKFSPRSFEEVEVEDSGTTIVSINLGGNRHIQLVDFGEDEEYADDQTTVRMDGIFRWRDESQGDVFTLPVEQETFDPDHTEILETKLTRLLGSRSSGDPMRVSTTGLLRSSEQTIKEIEKKNLEIGNYAQQEKGQSAEDLAHTANAQGTTMADILSEIDAKQEGSEPVEQ